MASTGLVQADFTAPRYSVDSIMETEHCVLMTKFQNQTLKAAVGSVLPPRAERTFHSRLIPHGFAIVGVDEIMEGFVGLEHEYPTGEGDMFLESDLRSTCLWRKEHIKLPNWTPPQQTQLDPRRTPPHSPSLLSPMHESSPARQPSPSPQQTLTDEAPQQNPPPHQLSPMRSDSSKVTI